MSPSFFVAAHWDPEAAVWTSESNIPGLVVEAADLAEFESLALALAPEMLADNLGIKDARVGVEFRVSEMREVAVA